MADEAAGVAAPGPGHQVQPDNAESAITEYEHGEAKKVDGEELRGEGVGELDDVCEYPVKVMLRAMLRVIGW